MTGIRIADHGLNVPGAATGLEHRPILVSVTVTDALAGITGFLIIMILDNLIVFVDLDEFRVRRIAIFPGCDLDQLSPVIGEPVGDRMASPKEIAISQTGLSQ